MSSEQSERLAVQYAEKSLALTVRGLLHLLEWSSRQVRTKDTAYKLGSQSLKELIQRPYSIETIDLKQDFLDSPIDLERFRELVEREKMPLALAWQDDALYFYTKDKSVLDHHLDQLRDSLLDKPELLSELTSERELSQAIEVAKSRINLTQESAVKVKEKVL